MKPYLLALIMGLASASALAESEWILTSKAKDLADYYVKSGSFEIKRNRNNQEVAVVQGKTFLKKGDQILLEQWYVTTADCRKGSGKVVSLNLDGEFQYDNDFSFGAGSVATTTAELICELYRRTIQETRGKGL